MKEFFKSPKKTAILGLVGSVIMLLIVFMTFNTDYLIFNMYNLYIIGLLVYFIIILMRMYKQAGNLKIANYLLIATYIISLCGEIFADIAEGESILIGVIIFGITILYLCNILFRKIKFINNKIYAVVVIGISLYQIISIGKYMFIYNDLIQYIMVDIIKILSYIATVPYFYNYYELLKEEK